MFGMLVPAEIKEVATRLNDAIERIRSKYRHHNVAELSAAIEREFQEEHREVRPQYLNFVLMELPEFVFSVNPTRHDDSPIANLSIHGRLRYQGFSLMADKSGWLCSATDSSYARATKDAKRLASWMQKSFGATDISKHVNELWN
jgi:hypothetical protein